MHVRDVVGAVLLRAAKILSGHVVGVEMEPDLSMLELDPVLFEQVLFNLLDNAAKYAPEGTTITIRLERHSAKAVLHVIDEGAGIPAADTALVFEKFHRARKGDRVRAGTGLGLAISRGFVEAMGGTIEANNRTDRLGAVLTLRFAVPNEASGSAA